MATRTAENKTYYINPSSITFVENSGYGVQLIQVSASSSCYIKVYDKENGVMLDDELNVRRWKVTAYNNKFPDGDTESWFIYVRLERGGTSALVVYDKRDRAVSGGIITTTTDKNGNEIKETGEADPSYFYIKIGTVGATDGISIIREINYDTGILGADGEVYAASDLLASMFVPHYDDPTDPDKLTWIEAKSHMGVNGGVTMYADNGKLDLPNIYDGLPVDGESLYWEDIKDEEGNVVGKVLKAKVTEKADVTLGSLTNVGEWADSVATADRIMVQKKGSDQWTSLALDEVGGIKSWKDIEELEDKPTTLKGYGITDAKISDGVITLGDNKITPLTQSTGDGRYLLKTDNGTLTARYVSSGYIEDANEGYNASKELRVYSAIPAEAENIPASSGYQNAILSMGLHANGSTAQFYLSASQPLFYRPNNTAKWNQIAYITDNVASATKLQTERTIWGQKFDGTANVSGALSGATTGEFSGEVSMGSAKVNGGKLTYNATDKYWKLDGDLLVTGAVTMFANDSAYTPSTIMDAINADGVNLKVIDGVLTFVGKTGGGTADSVAWENVDGRPTKLSEFTDDVVNDKYLPLTGGTVTGETSFENTIAIKRGVSITDERGYGIIGVNPEGWTGIPKDGSAIGIGPSDAPVYIRTKGDDLYHWRKDKETSYVVLDALNYKSYALPLTGGVITNGDSLYPLVINTTASKMPYIPFAVDGIHKGFVGGTDDGMFLQMGSASDDEYSTFKVKADGSAAISTSGTYYDVWTDKNCASKTAGNATKFGGFSMRTDSTFANNTVDANIMYKVDATALSTGSFYPIIFTSSQKDLYVRMYSTYGNASLAYNQNKLEFTFRGQGWTDTPKGLTVHYYDCYTASETTIGCIGMGTQDGYKAVWVRGGLTYYVVSNMTPYLRDGFTYGSETFTTGSTFHGGTNTNVNVHWTPQTTSGLKAMYHSGGLVLGEGLSVTGAATFNNAITGKSGATISGTVAATTLATNVVKYNNGYEASLSSAGWYRFATSSTANNLGGTYLFSIRRTYNNTNNESYIIAATVDYNGCNFTQIAGHSAIQLITQIRCTYTNDGAMYFDLYYNSTSANPVSVNAVGNCTLQTPTKTTSTLGVTAAMVLTDGFKSGVKTAYAMTLYRNATSGGCYIRFGANGQLTKTWAAGSNASHQFAWFYKDTDAGTDLQKMSLDSEGNLIVEGNLLVRGGITMYASGSSMSSSIMDAVQVDGTTIVKDANGNLALNPDLELGGGGVTSWNDLEDKPAWIGSTKPSYTFSEVGSKPTTLAGYGITDAKISGGVITLGSNSITPLTQSTGDERYLKLKSSTAQTVTSAEAGVMNFNSTSDDEAGIRLMMDNVNKGGLWTNDDEGIYLYNNVSKGKLGLTNAPYYNNGTSLYTLLHTGNYNSYAPTKTGGGASGTWGISISGNAATATTASKLSTVSKTAWGQTYWTSGGVPTSISGNMTGVGDITMSGTLYAANAKGIHISNTAGAYKVTMSIDGANNLCLGTGTAAAGYDTYLDGKNLILRTETSRTERVRITSDGKVGIGTTAPDYALHTVGAMYATSNIGSGNMFEILSSGSYRRTRFFCDASNTYATGGAVFIQAGNYAGTTTGGTLILSGINVANLALCKIYGPLLTTGGITMYSDIRKKTKLKDVELTLKQVAEAPLIEHYYNSDEKRTTHVGSIAQYWAGLNDWFCKKDNEGFYTMEIQNAALASAISVARELSRFESETDRRIRLLEEENVRLKQEIKELKTA